MRSLLAAFIACMVSPFPLYAAEAMPSAKPNIIFIMADDKDE